MKQRILFLSAAATLALAACNNEPEVVKAGGADPQAAELAKAAPVELPPAIVASRTYRCKDNSLVYIDFLNNNTAVYKTEQASAGTILTAPAAGEAYVADGHSVSSNSETINLTAPGKGSQSCKA